jgi:hypothetical protein
LRLNVVFFVLSAIGLSLDRMSFAAAVCEMSQ